MKYFFLFFVAFHLFTQTCYGKIINHLHVVFVSNVVDPNDYETETFMNLTTYPFIMGTHYSLMTRFGLIVNYSMIFTADPDNIFTVRGLDMDDYSTDYFQSLFTNQTTNTCNSTSLKGLQKALEITSEPSIILMASNRKLRDTVLLPDILEAMVAKTNPVIIFQIEDDGSVVELPSTNEEINANNYIPENVRRNKEKLMQEFSSIMEVSCDLLGVMSREASLAESNALQVPNILTKIPKLKSKSRRRAAKRNFIFVYDVVNATDQDIDEISVAIKTYIQYRNITFYNTSDQYGIVFSAKPDILITIDIRNYSKEDFRALIESRITNNVPKEPSLKGLRKALKYIPPFSWIVYMVKDVPHEDDHEMLPQIVQLINDKKAQVKILIFGCNYSCRYPLRILYRTIIDASKMASSTANLSTDWMEVEKFTRRQFFDLPLFNVELVEDASKTTTTTTTTTTITTTTTANQGEELSKPALPTTEHFIPVELYPYNYPVYWG